MIELLWRNRLDVDIVFHDENVELRVTNEHNHVCYHTLTEKIEELKQGLATVVETYLFKERNQEMWEQIQTKFSQHRVAMRERNLLFFELNMNCGGFEEQKRDVINYLHEIGFRGDVSFSTMQDVRVIIDDNGKEIVKKLEK